LTGSARRNNWKAQKEKKEGDSKNDKQNDGETQQTETWYQHVSKAKPKEGMRAEILKRGGREQKKY
jgi:hypothetical protein